jgi:hypothetical protein
MTADTESAVQDLPRRLGSAIPARAGRSAKRENAPKDGSEEAKRVQWRHSSSGLDCPALTAAESQSHTKRRASLSLWLRAGFCFVEGR